MSAFAAVMDNLEAMMCVAALTAAFRHVQPCTGCGCFAVRARLPLYRAGWAWHQQEGMLTSRQATLALDARHAPCTARRWAQRVDGSALPPHCADTAGPPVPW